MILILTDDDEPTTDLVNNTEALISLFYFKHSLSAEEYLSGIAVCLL